MSKYWNCCDCGDMDCPGKPNAGICNKKMNTGQTVYEQLQEFLKQCIDMGWSPEGGRPEGFRYIECYDDFIIMVVNNIEGDIERLDMDGYHWLFSIDSGIMEFMDWKRDYPDVTRFINHTILLNTENSNTESYYEDSTKYHYMIMGPMTGEEKVKYFVENALLPN